MTNSDPFVASYLFFLMFCYSVDIFPFFTDTPMIVEAHLVPETSPTSKAVVNQKHKLSDIVLCSSCMLKDKVIMITEPCTRSMAQ